MRIVVAGASGLIGKRLVSRLRARGDEVVALVRRARPAPWSEGIRLEEWDGRSQGPWAAAVDGAAAVVNLAGASVAGKRWSPAYKDEILRSRLDSTGAVVQAMGAAARKPGVLVNASAVGYYGPRGPEPLDEEAAPGDDFLAQVCRRWEARAREAEALGARVVLVRTGVVLAKEGGALPQFLPPFRAFVGGPLGSGRQWFPWIHLEDEVSLLVWAIDSSSARGPVNGAAPGGQTMGDFCAALGRVLHRPSWAKVPAAALRVLVGEFADVLTTGQHAVPARALQGGFRFRFADSEAALRDLLGGGESA